MSALSDKVSRKENIMSTFSDNLFGKKKFLSEKSDKFTKKENMSALSDKVSRKENIMSTFSDNLIGKEKFLSEKSGKFTKKESIITIFNENDKKSILTGTWLDDRHIDSFGQILSNYFDSCPIETWKLQRPECITPVTADKEHIRILFSGNSDIDGHWVCSFYDTKSLFIYDSMNKKKLHDDHKIFLNKLFPFYNNNINEKNVKFPLVQQQPNGNDCGVFAIAFATSLLFNIKPNKIIYDHSKMRSHLIKILESREIEHFPQDVDKSKKLTNIRSLNDIKFNRYERERQKIKYKYGKVTDKQKQLIKRERYNIKKLIVNQTRKRRYALNIANERSCKRLRYDKNIINQRGQKRKQYYLNLIENRKLKRMRYSSCLNEMRKQKRQQYRLRLIENRILKQIRYTLHKNVIRKQKRKQYHSNLMKNRKLKRMRYSLHFNKIRKQKREQYRASRKICKKYKMFNIRGNTILMKYSVAKYVHLVLNNLKDGTIEERKIEAQRLIKWCLFVRQNYLINIRKTLQLLKDKAELILTKLATFTNIDVNNKEIILCGESKHVSTSEAYFMETSYNDDMIKHSNPLIMNQVGQVTNILPLIQDNKFHKTVTKSWYCNEFCKLKNLIILHRYEQLLRTILRCKQIRYVSHLMQRIKKCTVQHFNNKLGHCYECYIKPEICHSLFLSINILSPHFPQVRNIARLINSLDNNINKLTILDKSMENGELNLLKEIIKSAEDNAEKLSTYVKNDIELNEDRILSNYSLAFKAMTKRSMDMPVLACVSCERLHCRKDITDISKMRKSMTGKYWENLVSHLKNETRNIDYICNYCLGHFRKDNMPPLCILNKLIVHEVPQMFFTLNDYEKILIQRAKSFQCVQRMGTVANKKVPHKQMIQKIKGRIFHLPLPLEETLKKICPVDKAINCYHELYILVRGVPTKSKIVWENLVDVKKIFEVLSWLKSHNPLYSEIILPNSHDKLLNDDLQNVEFHIDDEENKEKKAALLTQIIDRDAYYEQYSIYPIYEKRINETSTNLYQMLKVEAVPMDNRHEQLDLLCFPDLYCYGINGINEKRLCRVRDFDFAKSRLMSKHSQFRLNIQYLFFLLNNANMRQINSGIYHKLNTVNPRIKYTAAQFLKSLTNKELEGNLDTIFGRLPNTKQYWRKVRNDVNAMTREYGPATWFLTLSPSEWLWSEMGEYIRKVSPSLATIKSVNELVALDPVSAARFIQIKFQSMLDFICSSDNPIGKVKHFFVRREYQSRGMPHFHLLIWIEDAPIIGKSSNEEVIQFISKYVTCTIPDRKISPLLHRRVTTHQKHHHNSYCLRSKKSKTGFVKRCRFGFPRPVTDKLVLRNVVESIVNRRQLKSKSRLYDLPRKETEKNINDYNPVILTAWEGNMDIQFIGEQSAILNWYCTKYTTKSEHSYDVDSFDIINSTKSLGSCLWNIALRSLSNRECGALEAADTLLGIPLHKVDKDTVFRWLDVNEIRSRKLKTRNEIEKLDADSTDIFCYSFIENYYPNRPEELESCNLYDFAKWYDAFRTKPSGKSLTFYVSNTCLYLKKRSHPYIVNHYMYNVNVVPEKYYHSILLLFKPWRDLDELKGKQNTYADAFAIVKENLIDALKYHERIQDIQIAFDHVKELIDKEEKKINEEHCEKSINNASSDNQLNCRPLEAENVMQELKDVANKIADINLPEMISQLNLDQKRIFDTVVNTINGDSDKILRLFVSGEGGTGKSFLIKVIRCWIKQMINKDSAVTAPTGIAAFNIDGLTIHRLFQLPVEHGHTPKYTSLSDTVLKTLRNELKNTVLFIIDEVSMISNIMLMYINLRLNEIFDTTESDDGWFGKKHILLFGDLLQLPPVHDEPAFIKISNTKNEKYLGSLATTNIWTDLFHYDELTINVRQNNDTIYRDILAKIRFGIVSDFDIETLLSRKIAFQSQSINSRLLELCNYIKEQSSDAICLFPTCHLCDVLNEAMLQQILQPEIKLIARDEIDCASCLKKQVNKLLNKYEDDNSRTAGLNRIIIIKVGAKIMLRRNIDVTLGLVNGTIGTIAGVRKAPGSDDVDSINILLPSGITHTIQRISCKFQIIDKAYVVRYQFPISLSYGVTIHKSQGLSLKTAIVDAGNSIFICGQIYVALSRVTSLQGLHLINIDPSSIKASEKAILEYNRLRTLYRPDLALINCETKCQNKIIDCVWAIPTNITDVQIKQNINVNDDIIKGFTNSDDVSCYANTAMQCIFHCSFLRNILLKRKDDDDFKILVNLYYMNKDITLLKSFGIRQLLGNIFIENKQQDVSEFLTAIVNYVTDIKSVVEHRLSYTLRCKTCSRTKIIYQQNIILKMPVCVKKNKTAELQDIINEEFSHWNEVEKICENCGENEMISKINIIDVRRIIIIQLMLFSLNDRGLFKITKYNIKGIPTAKVKLAGNTYKVISAIIHNGDDVDTGHYTAMIRGPKTSWYNINDDKIEKKPWPRGAKNVYILFLEKVK